MIGGEHPLVIDRKDSCERSMSGGGRPIIRRLNVGRIQSLLNLLNNLLITELQDNKLIISRYFSLKIDNVIVETYGCRAHGCNSPE